MRPTIIRGLVGLSLLVVGGWPAAAQPKPDDKLPEMMKGSPVGKWKEFEAKKVKACHIWYDPEEKTWHVKTAWLFDPAKKGPNRAGLFEGTVAVDKGELKLLDAEGEGRKTASKQKAADYLMTYTNGAKFRFTTGPATDGFSFKAPDDATVVIVRLKVQGDPNAELIRVGKDGKNPPAASFCLPAHPKSKKD
jgi:hypothetical protein